MRMTTFETDFVKMFFENSLQYMGIALLMNLFSNQTCIIICITNTFTSCLTIRVFNCINDKALINQLLAPHEVESAAKALSFVNPSGGRGGGVEPVMWRVGGGIAA